MTRKELRGKTLAELEALWTTRRDELLAIKREIDRRKGEEIPAVGVDFESYVTH